MVDWRPLSRGMAVTSMAVTSNQNWAASNDLDLCQLPLHLPCPPCPVPHQGQPFQLGGLGIGGVLLSAVEVVREAGPQHSMACHVAQFRPTCIPR
jgi:hypothetical protein